MTQPRKKIFLSFALLCAALLSALSTAQATPQSSPSADPKLPDATPIPDASAQPKVNEPDGVIKYGFLTSLISNNANVKNMGFGWVSYGIFWSDEEPAQGQYSWLSGANNVDNIADGARNANVNILIRISRTPAWARDPDCSGCRYLPSRQRRRLWYVRGRTGRPCTFAPNRGSRLHTKSGTNRTPTFEWGGLCPDPARYTGLLRAAYPQIKAADSKRDGRGRRPHYRCRGPSH